jgi:hypothetical protein
MVDLQRLLAEEAEAAEAGADIDAVYHRNIEPAKDPSQVYSLRMPVERIEEIRTLAAKSRVAPTALMRLWVLERLDHELGRRSDAALRHASQPGEELLVVTKAEFTRAAREAVMAVLAVSNQPAEVEEFDGVDA